MTTPRKAPGGGRGGSRCGRVPPGSAARDCGVRGARGRRAEQESGSVAILAGSCGHSERERLSE